MELLSIQSSVAFGHVGNSAAVFPLQRLGIEAWAVNTVHFSNHTGYGEWRGPLLSADDLRAVIQGVEERGALERVAAVLSGYQGAEEVGQVVLDTVARVKELNPAAVYCCDPVMGDVGRGMFVRPGIPEFMRDRVVPAADVITPNHFELDFLSGRETRTVSDVLDAADAVRASGPRDRAGHQRAHRRDPGWLGRRRRRLRRRRLVLPYAAAADLPQRLRRRDRRGLPGPPAAHRVRRDRAPAGHLDRLRRSWRRPSRRAPARSSWSPRRT